MAGDSAKKTANAIDAEIAAHSDVVAGVSRLGNYQDLFLKLLDSAFLLNPATNAVLDANPAAEALLGLPRETLLGADLSDRVHEQSRETFQKNLRVALRRYYPHTWDCYWIGPQGATQIFQMTGCRIQLNNRTEVLQLLMRDVTQERQQQAQIEKYVVQLEHLNKKLEELSYTDAMTGLYNYRYFAAQIELEQARVQRYGGCFAIVFFDADHFKHYNDQHGHPAGDALLKSLAQIIKKNCRPTDLAARYGGEEFAVLLMNSDWKAAAVFAERVRREISTADLPHARHQPMGLISVSGGVASFPDDGMTAFDVLKAADIAVYQSKSGGRNRITCHSDVVKKS